MKSRKHNIAELLAEGEKKLLHAGIDNREAIDIFEALFGISKTQLIAHNDAPATVVQKKKFLLAIQKRCKGIPFAYCVGKQWFYGFPFVVSTHVLIPRPDTEILVDYAIRLIKKLHLNTITDIGTGSGCIAISLAKSLPGKKILATDISRLALTIAKKNAHKNHVDAQIVFKKTDLLHGISKSQPLDLVCANLPYLTHKQAAEVRYEPHKALYGGKKGLELLTRLLQQANQRKIHHVLLEIDPRQKTELGKLIKKSFSEYTLSFTKDLSGHIRVAHLESKY